MQLIDTHAHLYVEAFDTDREQMIKRAMDAGVNHFFIPAIDSTYTKRMNDLKKNYPKQVHLMAGLHPCHVKENVNDELDHVSSQLEAGSFCAIGEIGIDLYWDKSFLKEQQRAFSTQIEWAKKYNLPIVIHCREAFDEVFEILDQHQSKDLSGIFHCFTGTQAQAKRAISLNFKLGIGGVVTFKNGKIDQFLGQLPLEAIVLETDAPYLSPKPYRGKRNESAYLPLILEKVAQCYSRSNDEIALLTTENVKSVFKSEYFEN